MHTESWFSTSYIVMYYSQIKSMHMLCKLWYTCGKMNTTLQRPDHSVLSHPNYWRPSLNRIYSDFDDASYRKKVLLCGNLLENSSMTNNECPVVGCWGKQRILLMVTHFPNSFLVMPETGAGALNFKMKCKVALFALWLFYKRGHVNCSPTWVSGTA